MILTELKLFFLALGLFILIGIYVTGNITLATEPTMTKNEADTDYIVLGMGCFWGAEKRMSALPGVIKVESGYANGEIDGNYEAILAHERALRLGRTQLRNHAEVVKVIFDPAKTTLEAILIQFWENHNPTQGDRQGNDIGSNYRSAIYTHNLAQQQVARKTQETYQQALILAGYSSITTQIAPLTVYYQAEEYHQNYLLKHPNGYCGLGGTGVKYPIGEVTANISATEDNLPVPLDGSKLSIDQQLVVFEREDCPFCEKFNAEIASNWQSQLPLAKTFSFDPPSGWHLEKVVFATPTIVLFRQGKEVSRYTGYTADSARFWKWLGFQLLSPEQQKIAFEQGTEYPFTGSHLDEKRPGAFVDPITGALLFRSDSKFDSGTGWPSFFNPIEGALTFHTDNSHGTTRVEVRSASSGIHLGHVFDDGPPPTHKRYCINGNVLKFIPDGN